MVVRDSNLIIVQHRIDDPDYMDGGDSIHRTGIMALCGSEVDCDLLPIFQKDGMIFRHPFQKHWDNPNNATRDQLIPYMAGLWATHRPKTARLIMNKHKARGWRAQNTHEYEGAKKPWYRGADIMLPDVRNHLRLCSGLKGSAIGYLFLNLSIIWSAKIKPFDEQNNIACMVIVAGEKYLNRYKKLHPNYKKAIREYWGNWRDQVEIGEMLIKRIEAVK